MRGLGHLCTPKQRDDRPETGDFAQGQAEHRNRLSVMIGDAFVIGATFTLSVARGGCNSALLRDAQDNVWHCFGCGIQGPRSTSSM